MASIWNPAVVLDVNQGTRDNLCVAMGAKKLCGNSIGPVRPDSDEIIRRMSQMSPSSAEIPRQLALLAPKTLCRRHHRDKPATRQDEDMKRIWTRKIREYILQTQRIEAAQQTTKSVPTPNIIPKPQVPSPVVPTVAAVHSGNLPATPSEPKEDFDFESPSSVQPDFPDFDDSAIDLSADVSHERSDDDETEDDEIHDDEIYDNDIQDDEIHDDDVQDGEIHDDDVHDDESEDHEEQVEQPDLHQKAQCHCESLRRSESQAQNQTQTTLNQPSPPTPLKFELSLQLTLQTPPLFYFSISTPSSTPQLGPSLSYLFAHVHTCRDVLLRGLSSFRKSVTNSELFLAAKALHRWAWSLFEGVGILGFAVLGWAFGGLGLVMRR